MEYDIVASIVLFNTNIDQLNKVIDCFIKCNLKKKLILVDNSPSDTFGNIYKSNEYIEYIFNGVNLGYGSAHNIAMRKYIDKSKYHLVLNPDIYFEDGVIEKLLKFMEENLSVGHCMPKVIYPNGELQYLCKLIPNPFDLIFRRFLPFKSIKEKRNNIFELRFSNYDKAMEVPYLSGCFMFLRTELLKQCGLFDERFFMYPEDIDLTRRMHKMGKTIFYPEVTIVHDHAKESYKSFKMLFIHVENMIKYFNKWGWFFDKDRRKINSEILHMLNLKK